MSGSISTRTSIHNEHRVVDATDDVKSFKFQESYYSDDVTNFKTVKTFLPIAISEDYKRKISDNFFNDIFERCTDSFEIDKSLSEEERDQKVEQYSEDIEKLDVMLKKVVLPYVSLSFSNKQSKAATVSRAIMTRDKLVEKNNPDAGKGRPYPVKAYLTYKSVQSVTDRINNQKLVLRAKEDIADIIYKLSDLSDLSAYLVKADNTYREFTSEIITKMCGNTEQLYPRSIVNYSAFQFCAGGYPFDTKSGRIYSVSNVNSNIKNKFDLIDIFYKNMDAIINFLHDVNFIDKTADNKHDFELQTLKNAYGICIALCAFVGEEECHKEILTTSLDGSLLDNQSAIGSVFYNRTNRRINEVHE